jgi:Tfp pilus assembly protein PilN
MRAVNLLPSGSESRKSFRKEDPAVVVGSVLGIVVLFALVAGFLNVHSKVNSEQKKLSAARTELARLSLTKKPAVAPTPIVQKPIIQTPAVTSEEQPRLAAITTAMSTRIAWDRILREFSLVLPSDVKLTGLTLTAPPAPVALVAGAPEATPSQGLSITGTAFSHDGVARLLSRLMLIPDLSNVMLSSSTAGATGSSSVQFSISASIKGAPAPPPLPAPVVPVDTTTDGASS